MTADPSAIAAARARLEQVNAKIAAHPLSSVRFVRAREVVSAAGDAERDAVEASLRAQELPSLAEQGRMLALGLVSLARLNRKRLRLEKKLSMLTGEAG